MCVPVIAGHETRPNIDQKAIKIRLCGVHTEQKTKQHHSMKIKRISEICHNLFPPDSHNTEVTMFNLSSAVMIACVLDSHVFLRFRLIQSDHSNYIFYRADLVYPCYGSL